MRLLMRYLIPHISSAAYIRYLNTRYIRYLNTRYIRYLNTRYIRYSNTTYIRYSNTTLPALIETRSQSLYARPVSGIPDPEYRFRMRLRSCLNLTGVIVKSFTSGVLGLRLHLNLDHGPGLVKCFTRYLARSLPSKIRASLVEIHSMRRPKRRFKRRKVSTLASV